MNLLAEGDTTPTGQVLRGSVDPQRVAAAARGLDGVGLSWDGARLAGQAAIRTSDRRAMTTLLDCARTLQVRPAGSRGGSDADPSTEPIRDEGRLSDREREVLALVPAFPRLVWGRDAHGAGDMWNSNSLVSWLLARSGHDMAPLGPPRHGRAPGWQAGLVAARETGPADRPVVAERGLTLIGLSVGHSIKWPGPGGKPLDLPDPDVTQLPDAEARRSDPGSTRLPGTPPGMPVSGSGIGADDPTYLLPEARTRKPDIRAPLPRSGPLERKSSRFQPPSLPLSQNKMLG